VNGDLDCSLDIDSDIDDSVADNQINQQRKHTEIEKHFDNKASRSDHKNETQSGLALIEAQQEHYKQDLV
jgi:hypothetical protein